LKAIGEIANNRTPEKIISLLEQHEMKLDIDMRQLHRRVALIHQRRGLIRYGLRAFEAMEPDNGVIITPPIIVEQMEERKFVLGQPNDFSDDETFYSAFARFYNQAAEMRIDTSFPICGYHESPDCFFQSPGRPDCFFSLDPTGNRKWLAGEYLVGFARGPYGEFGDLPQRMSDYADEKNLRISGPVYSVYLHDEICVKDSMQYLAQISVAVSRRSQL
jgi:hypothetical protein